MVGTKNRYTVGLFAAVLLVGSFSSWSHASAESHRRAVGIETGHAVFEVVGEVNNLAGTPDAPFPVRRQVRTRLRVLDVSPFALKYTITALDRARLRPYVAAGADIVVVITKQIPTARYGLMPSEIVRILIIAFVTQPRMMRLTKTPR